jgi:hypothetical protein
MMELEWHRRFGGYRVVNRGGGLGIKRGGVKVLSTCRVGGLSIR